MDELNTKYTSKGVQILAIDVTDRKDLTEKVASDISYKGPVLLDDKQFARKEYNVVATPTTYRVDTSGKLVFKHVGYAPGMEKVLEKEIELLLARKPA